MRPITLTIHLVTKATMLFRFLYAAPAWYGFPLASDLSRIECLFSQAIRMSYLPQDSPSFWQAKLITVDLTQSPVTPRTLCGPSFHLFSPVEMVSVRRPFFFTSPKDTKNFILQILFRSLLPPQFPLTPSYPPLMCFWGVWTDAIFVFCFVTNHY